MKIGSTLENQKIEKELQLLPKLPKSIFHWDLMFSYQKIMELT